jgi:hypothetical protein
MIEAQRRVQEQFGSGEIPDAPFRTTWPVQLFKRALRDAVASGKEWIGWTTGETQAARYDLSKQVDRIIVLENAYAPGTYTVTARRNSDEVVNKSANSQSEIADLIGKDLAKKAVADIEAAKQRPVPKYATTLEGLDLKVGGEGMKGFYDQILPKEISKYVKQWGGQVEKGKVETPKNKKRADDFTDAELLQELNRSNESVSIWRVNITPQMRESIKKAGQALFVGTAAAAMSQQNEE